MPSRTAKRLLASTLLLAAFGVGAAGRLAAAHLPHRINPGPRPALDEDRARQAHALHEEANLALEEGRFEEARKAARLFLDSFASSWRADSLRRIELAAEIARGLPLRAGVDLPPRGTPPLATAWIDLFLAKEASDPTRFARLAGGDAAAENPLFERTLAETARQTLDADTIPLEIERCWARVQKKEGNLDEVLAAYDRILARENQPARAADMRFRRARLLHSDRKEFAKAERAYREFLLTHPDSHRRRPVLLFLGEIRVHFGDEEEAASFFGQLAEAPDEPRDHLWALGSISLAWTYLRRDRDPEATEVLERFLLAAPEGPHTDRARALLKRIERDDR